MSLIYSVNLIYEIKNKRYWGSDIRMTTRPCFVRPNYVRACEPKIFSQEFAVCGSVDVGGSLELDVLDHLQ